MSRDCVEPALPKFPNPLQPQRRARGRTARQLGRLGAWRQRPGAPQSSKRLLEISHMPRARFVTHVGDVQKRHVVSFCSWRHRGRLHNSEPFASCSNSRLRPCGRTDYGVESNGIRTDARPLHCIVNGPGTADSASNATQLSAKIALHRRDACRCEGRLSWLQR